MASFKGNGRGDGLKRRKGDPRHRRLNNPGLESLEPRRLLSTGTTGTWHPTNSNLADPQNGPMANLGGDLVQVYQQYIAFENDGGGGSFTTPLSKSIEVQGSEVGIDIRGSGNFQTFEQAMVGLGMQVTATAPKENLVEGGIPISALPAAAEEAQTIGGSAIYRPTFSYVGTANNEGETAIGAAAAKTTYKVDGTGEKIGIVSDSVDQYPSTGKGLAASIASGDLPNNVQVLNDGPSGASDEGRAMLENVHDVAPGAALAFASAEGPTAMGGVAYAANSIQALANAGSNIIADDFGYPDEPFFQDGIISQAVNNVTGQGVTYLSAVGNSADSGYESPFHGITATVTGVGTGQFMNFDPSGATKTPLLGINVYTAGTGVTLQWDQSFYAASGTSDVQIYILNAAGTIVTQGANNPSATEEPYQATLAGLPVGQYYVAIQVISGAAPNHIVFQATNDGGFNVDHTYTLNGANATAGITYPTAFGHSAAANTISVGAVPWWGAAPYNTTGTPNNEPFSSFGPTLEDLDANGNPITPQVLQKPDISGPDGGNTSFFAPGEVINTTTPPNPEQAPYPGQPSTVFPEPKTTTNLSQNLPSFFGTSAAVENVAGVVALMKQSVPSLTRSEIVTDLDATATPLDGQTKGTWNPQAGYGLVSASAALAAAQILKVEFISPGANQTVAAAPTYLQVQFTLPVNLSTVSASDLTVTGPNGAIVTVGQPYGVDSPTDPTFVRFPITITPAPGKMANGTYHDTLVRGSIVSEAGLPLSGTTVDQFNIQQTAGPRVAGTTRAGRIVTITFNEAVNPATITPANVYLFRDGGVSNPNFNPQGVTVSQLPGATLTFNSSTNTATIDLTNVAQSSLPTDHYGLVVTTGVTDVVGNPLNGSFSGVFPSGTSTPSATGSVFFQDFGVITVQAPIITSLTLAPASDSGIQGDSNTNVTTPSLVGQITATFPGTLSGVLVYAEFNGIAHPGVANGGLDLAVGANGRGYTGHYDVQAVTNALGQFTINYPAGVAGLPEGLNLVRVVVVGQPDQPPFPGYSSTQTASFRIDETLPYVGSPGNGVPATSIPENANINSLTNLTLNVIDPVNPQTIGSPFAVNPKISIPALNPTTADNIQNYKLLLVNGSTVTDESSFIASATFVSTSARVSTADPYTGQVTIAFNPGLPTGTYKFLALSSAYGNGLSDAAGNPFGGYPDEPGAGGSLNYELDFNLQPTPTYITSYQALTVDPSSPTGLDVTGPRANYELPVPGITPRATAPPTAFTVDFSNPLNPNVNYTNDVELVRSADTATSLPDGNFGDLGITNTSGYTAIAGLTVTLGNSVPGSVFGQYGFDNRLTIKLPAGLTLPADYYRIYLPNNGPTALTDIYGNQLDGEFLGYQNATGKFVDQLPNGTVRGSGGSELPDLSGDGSPGGAFMTGFVVVPNGNIIYTNAAAIYNPQVPSETPDGSQAKPYPVLAPEAVPTSANGGDLNSPVNAGSNFNTAYDYSGDGTFEPSAFFAAQQRVEANGGPVVIIAQQSIPTRDPSTGATVQQPFVLEAPSTSTAGASAAIPAMTTLVMQEGVILKMRNASLFVQNQGSALQIAGGPNSYQAVTVTSYNDNSIGGVTNGNPNSVPFPGDYGGIVFRNFSQAALPGETSPRSSLFPGQIPITGDQTADGRLKGQFATLGVANSQVDAVSGADDIMSSISFLTETYAGGTVPRTSGTQYDGITLLNSRPAVVNSTLADAGTSGSAVAGLSADVDSLRADDVAQGPLIRNDQFVNNALNGIYIRAEVSNGLAEATNAESYPVNPTTAGGSANYVLNSPYPYLLTSQMQIGTRLNVVDRSIADTTDRLYITPGMLVKFESGAWLEIGQDGGFGEFESSAASLVVGDPTYIRQYDQNHAVAPVNANGTTNTSFRANSTTLAKVLFTSLNDNGATTSFVDPTTQITTTIVAALPAQSDAAKSPVKGNWGGIQLDAGTRDTINDAIFDYGGGFINTAVGASTEHAIEINKSDAEGAYVSITNNMFLNNADVPINTTPNAWLAGNPQTPLNSGAPFIHGNEFIGNDYNGVGVQGGTLSPNAPINSTLANYPNLDVNSVWTGSDFTFFLRNTIVLGPLFGGIPAIPSATTLVAPPTPSVTMTLQSTAANTVLADGSTVAAPGVPLVVKLLSTGSQPPAEALGTITPSTISTSYQQGAGFIAGVDNGIDPTADQLIDPGAFSELRIVGIGADQTSGQSRVPVIITSAYDNSVGTTVNGVQMNDLVTGSAQKPLPGDGGVIYFGANSMSSYNLTDPRQGSIIDNADISYITRIEQQGGGIMYGVNLVPGTSFTPSLENLFGLPLTQFGTGGGTDYADQYNTPKSITVSDSNLSSFSSAGFYAHPDSAAAIIIPVNFTPPVPAIGRTGGINGEPTHDYFYNDTFTNMPTGVYILSQTGADTLPAGGGVYPVPAEAVFLNDDFYNDAIGVHTNGLGPGLSAHVATLVMDSIFDGSTTSAAVFDGEDYGGIENQNQNHAQTILPSQLVYDDFFGNAANLTGTGVRPDAISQAYTTDPGFRNASTGNFFLLPTSSVIDVARSELGPSIFGDMLYPQVSPADPNNPTGPTVRNEPVVVGSAFDTAGHLVYSVFDPSVVAGDVNVFGGLDAAPFQQDIVTLPGRVYTATTTGAGAAAVNYPDQWVAVPLSAGTGTQGNAGNAGTNAYVPILGQRDQAGDVRVPDPNSHNLGGFGSKPYFDLGAFEYIIQNPPVVDAVDATSSSGTTNIYTVNGIGGVNQLPTSILVKFSEQLSPATLNGMSVILLASGGDGIFGNGNSPADRAINLTGDLSFDPTTDILTISTAGIFTSAAAANDEYRLVLKGTGASVIRNTDGLALDGTNLDAAGNQLALPSGADQFPGSDFQVTFDIDTHTPTISSGTFVLDPASDTSGGLHITKNNLPTFDGTVSDIFPPANPLLGQTVIIDISSQGNGVFDILDAGQGTTLANGTFQVTLTKPIPDTPNTVGTNGIKGSTGATYAEARVRIINSAGNASNQPTDPLSEYEAEGAVTTLEVDTKPPTVVSLTPASGTVATVGAGGLVTVTVTFSENIKATSINANSVLVESTGGTGSFATPVFVPIVAGSLTTSYSTAAATLGQETITFGLAAASANDQYRIVLKGTGSSPVTDIAGNALDGQGIGSGSDYTSSPFVVYTAAKAHLIYVQSPASVVGTLTGKQGTRENPFPTIGAAMKAASIGDDVLVLPGAYRENVTVRPGIRLLSADTSSTDTLFTAGSPYDTLIYGVPGTSTTNGENIVTVGINGATPGIPTEVSGFSVISPLVGDVNFGSIDPTNTAIQALNSNASIDRNIVFDAGIGISVGTTAAGKPTSQVFDNLVAGNIYGIGVSDNGQANTTAGLYSIVNNTIADNTTGLYNVSSTPNVIQANVINDIFYSNHDLTTTRSGTGILSLATNTLGVGWDLFYNNGINNLGAAQASGSFGQFVPTNLSSSPDALNNLIGNPYFVQPQDPRPNGDGPAVFLNYSDFDLTSRSVAINAANPTVAPASDFLYRTPVTITGHGFAGTGPASIGAFYFGGKTGTSGGSGIIFGGGSTTTGGTTAGTGTKTGGGGNGTTSAFPAIVSEASLVSSPIGGGIALGTRQFGVVTTSLSDNGSLHASDATNVIPTEAGPSYIDVNFSDDINPSTISPTDLVLSGSGLNAANPAKATGLGWIDDHAVRFFLSGTYNNSGTVDVSISQASIKDTSGAAIVGFNDAFKVAPAASTSPTSPVSPASPAAPTPLVAPVVQPIAAAAPFAVAATSAKPTAKQLKQQAAQLKAEKAAEAKAAKVKAAEVKAVHAKALKAAKAAHKAKKAK